MVAGGLQTEWPAELDASLGDTVPELVVKGTHRSPVSKALRSGAAGSGIVLFMLFALSFLWLPVLGGGETTMTVNGEPVTVTMAEPGPLVLPTVAILFFLGVGGVLLWLAFHHRRPGPWFAVTPEHLVVVSEKSVERIPWTGFTGKTSCSRMMGPGTITLERTTGRVQGSSRGRGEYIPDRLYVVGIPDAIECERIFRKHIDAARKTEG